MTDVRSFEFEELPGWRFATSEIAVEATSERSDCVLVSLSVEDEAMRPRSVCTWGDVPQSVVLRAIRIADEEAFQREVGPEREVLQRLIGLSRGVETSSNPADHMAAVADELEANRARVEELERLGGHLLFCLEDGTCEQCEIADECDECEGAIRAWRAAWSTCMTRTRRSNAQNDG